MASNKQGSKQFIYVYKTPFGVWADFDYNKAAGKIVETLDATDPYKVMEFPGTAMPDRVRALAERLVIEKGRPQVPEPPPTPPAPKLPTTFWGRLKYAFTGELDAE